MVLLCECHLVRELQLDNNRAIVFKTKELFSKGKLGWPTHSPLIKGNTDSSKGWQTPWVQKFWGILNLSISMHRVKYKSILQPFIVVLLVVKFCNIITMNGQFFRICWLEQQSLT